MSRKLKNVDPANPHVPADKWVSRNFYKLMERFDPSPLEHKTVSVIGKMGMPPSAPTILQLTVEKLVSHDDIAIRAFDVFKSGAGGSQDAHWFQAERELLGLSIANQRPAAL